MRFPSRGDAIQWMIDQRDNALDDGFEVDGDPLDGHFSYTQDGAYTETLVMSEADRLEGRLVTPVSSNRRPRPLP